MTEAEKSTITDLLRQHGLEDVARWVEHPEAVRTLLKLALPVGECQGDESRCLGEGDWYAHSARCEVAAAWRSLGDPRGAADIANTHDEALRDNRVIEHNREQRRLNPDAPTPAQTWRTATAREWNDAIREGFAGVEDELAEHSRQLFGRFLK